MIMTMVDTEVLQNNTEQHVGCCVSASRIIPEHEGRQADYITAAAATESSITSDRLKLNEPCCCTEYIKYQT